jgi:thioredoxin 1
MQRRYSPRSRIGVDRSPRAAHTAAMTTVSFAQTSDDAFAADVLESDVPVLVDFWAAWCGPCRAMHPILDELATERDDVRVVGLDVEANQAVAAKYGVLSMPTFILFRHGEPVLRLIGSRPRRRLEQELAEVL